jgi:hypothetical protein
MTLSHRTAIAPMALLVVALAAAGWYFAPHRGPAWIIGAGTMIAIWLVVVVLERVCTSSESERRFRILSVVLAGMLLAVSLGATLADTLGFKGGMLLERGPGIATGLMLLVLGNTLPKVLGPLASRSALAAHMQAMQLWAGWTLALAGILTIATWVLAPVAQAQNIATAIAATAVVLIIGRWALRSRSART